MTNEQIDLKIKELDKKDKLRRIFEDSEQCNGCGYCLSGKYIHPLGYKWSIKKIAGKEEALIIFGSIGIFTIILILLLIFIK